MSFSKKKITESLLKILLVILLFIIIEYFAASKAISDIIEGRWLEKDTIVSAILFFSGYAFAWGWYRIRYRLDSFLDDAIRLLKSAYKGYLGEKNTHDKLKDILGSEYKIYPNFVIPGTKFDNDFIIIGPKGIISIEVKNISGKYDFIGEDTYKHDSHYGNECTCKLSEYQSPSREIIRHRVELENWLIHQGFRDIKPVGFVLLVRENSLVGKIENPSGYYVVKGLSKLSETLEKTWFDFKLTSDLQQKLKDLFNKFS